MANLVIVSNRLPVVVKKVNGRLEYSESVGGLAMGLASYAADSRNKWIGWPGLPSDGLTKADKKAITEKLRERNCYPLFLTKKQIDGFYNGYSNRFLWPLFHDVPISKSAWPHQETYWQAYQEVNNLYAEKVLELSEPDSNIWVHDYLLLLLPELLRLNRPDAKIGFFMHITFPTTKDFAQLHDGKALVRGMLGADLVGFHITLYAENFQAAVRHYGLGRAENGLVTYGERVVRITDFPIGIDFDKWRKAGRTWAVRKEHARLSTKYRGKKIIITADRLDPAKGYLQRVEAYRDLLEQNPRFHGKVLLVMFAVPTRAEIEEYQKLKQGVERLVDEINGRFGTDSWRPVEYNYAALPFDKLRALYQRADVMFVTPLRDGMNLTAKEYLASKPPGHGVLVLSETAGAAQELHEAVLVNPRDPDSMTAGLKQALTMPNHSLVKRVRHMQDIIQTSTIQTWAGGFMLSLRRSVKPEEGGAQNLSADLQQRLATAYHTALKRVLLLDYDGTLAPFAPTPEEAKPTAELKKLLKHLANMPGTDVVLVSGRSTDNLDEWLGGLGLHFGAEHGAYTRSRSAKKWQAANSKAQPDWQSAVAPLLEFYADQTPGARVERKTTALVWHYRQAKPYYAQKNLVILKRILRPIADSLGLLVRQGHKILEVKAADIHKGIVAETWLKGAPDFVLLIGDDYTDEDMFKAAPPDAYTIKVGRGDTAARYRVKDVDAVLSLLSSLGR